VTSSTPGPGSYTLPEVHGKGTTSVFKSRSKRTHFAEPIVPVPRFDGRTWLLRRNEL
jgi:hypothetical protein